MNSELLIQSLLEQTQLSLIHAEKLKKNDIKTLVWKENEKSWNILECLEHLNLYSDFYLPKIEKKIKKSTTIANLEFESGILGKYFAKSMLPKEKLNKMKTFKDKNPSSLNLNKEIIDKYINQQIKLLDLLNQSRHVSLNKIKIQTSISNLIKLKLGDVFQFIINHTIRHLKQIDKILIAENNKSHIH